MFTSWLRYYGSPRGVVLLVSLAVWACLSWYLQFEQTGLHKRDLDFAKAIYSGHLIETPAYPMWGYPLLLGLVDNGVIVLQWAVLVCLLPAISSQVMPYFQSRHSRLSETGLTILMSICLIPWFYLTLCYNSSATLSLMLMAAYVTLLRFDSEPHRLRVLGIAGLFLGLAYNFRTEALIVTIAIIAVMGMSFIYRGLSWNRIRAIGLLGGIFAIGVVPYLIYTKMTVGTPLLSTTNGGAVLYDQLGILPNNPWNIEPTDEFAEQEAKSFTDQGAWSLVADREFKKRFFSAIAAHPKAFLMRAISGIKENVTMGLMLPRMEEILNLDERDGMKVYLARQLMKNAVGLRMNRNEIERAAGMGVEMKDIGLRDRTLVLVEFLARVFYVSLWVVLLAAWPIGCYRCGFLSWNSLITSAFLGTLMVLAMFVQTGMRVSTTFLPSAVIFALQAHAGLFDRRTIRSRSDSERSSVNPSTSRIAA
jgi:hypothetical protein